MNTARMRPFNMMWEDIKNEKYSARRRTSRQSNIRPCLSQQVKTQDVLTLFTDVTLHLNSLLNYTDILHEIIPHSITRYTQKEIQASVGHIL
jgi:hypothetical protein